MSTVEALYDFMSTVEVSVVVVMVDLGCEVPDRSAKKPRINSTPNSERETPPFLLLTTEPKRKLKTHL